MRRRRRETDSPDGGEGEDGKEEEEEEEKGEAMSEDAASEEAPRKRRAVNRDMPTGEEEEPPSDGQLEGHDEEGAAAGDDYDDDGDDDEELQDDTRSGKIKMIECVDFMCHKRLVVDLNPRINFITGPNGSGKSAVIAALQACLGMSARATQRGKTLKGLIRQGSKGNALVRVTLYNDGPNAFRRSEYGSSIIIERMIKQGGTSSYKLRNGDTNRVISTKRSVLDEIVAKYDIVVSNPCCILDQETSKSFLRGNAKEKYRVFMDATHLQQMQTLYAKEETDRLEAKKAHKVHEKKLLEMRESMKEKEARCEELQSFERLGQELELMKRKKVWALVRAEFDKVQISQNYLDARVEKLAKRKAELEALLNETNSIEEQRAALQQSLTTCRDSAAAVRDEIKRASNQLEDASQRTRKAGSAVNKAQRELSSAQQKVQVAQANLTKFVQSRASMDSSRREQVLQRQQEQDRLTKAIEECERRIVELNGGIRDLQARREETDLRVKEIFTQKKLAEDHVNQLISKLERAERTSDDSARFGSDVPRLLAAIQSSRGPTFSRPPVHIGLNVQLTDMSWWRPCEEALKPVLRCFLLNDRRDFQLLKRLCKEERIKMPPTIISRFSETRYDTKANTPEVTGLGAEVTLMTDVLKIADCNVFNALVDNARVETIALVRSSDDAQKVCFGRSGGGGVRMPPKMGRCFDMDGNSYMVMSGSEYKQASHNTSKQSRYFAFDRSEAIREVKEELAQAKKAHQALRKDLEAAREAANRAMEEDKGADRAIHTAMHSKTDMQRRLEELGQAAAAEATADDDQYEISRLENLVESARAEVDAMEGRLAQVHAEAQAVAEERAPFEQQLALLNQRREQVDLQTNEARTALESFEMNTRSATAHRQALERKVAKQEAQVAQLGGELEALRASANSSRDHALELYHGQEEDVEGVQLEVLAGQMIQTELLIEKERAKLGARRDDIDTIIEEARREAIRAREAFDKSQKIYKDSRKLIRAFKASHDLRVEGWEDMKDHCKDKMATLFRHYLSARNHKGNIEFDDERKSLEFRWSKEDMYTQESYGGEADVGETQDAGQLSGGEKSFTTLAFLVAMGALVECPFRVMDEFDVFMDTANRRTSMKILVQMARGEQAANKQFIFITPHDISQIPSGEDIHKLRMQPPVDQYGSRTQQATLDFAA